MEQIPLSHISDAVYKTSIDWINQRSIEALGSFVIWCLDSIVADLASQHAVSKGSKKVAHQVSSKSQVIRCTMPLFLLQVHHVLHLSKANFLGYKRYRFNIVSMKLLFSFHVCMLKLFCNVGLGNSFTFYYSSAY